MGWKMSKILITMLAVLNNEKKMIMKLATCGTTDRATNCKNGLKNVWEMCSKKVRQHTLHLRRCD